MTKMLLLATCGAIALGACTDKAPQTQESGSPSTAVTPVASDAPPPLASEQAMSSETTAMPMPSQTAPLAPPASTSATSSKGEAGARDVLLTWARALENHQFAKAWEQFGNPPASRADYVGWWSRYRTINVAVPSGTLEGAAGSLYYSSQATLTGLTTSGKPYRLEGTVVLRRANDVPGATPEQLRWHIESAALSNAAP